MLHFFGRLLLSAFFCLLVGACSTRTAGMAGTVNSLLYGPGDVSATMPLNPSLRYLRVVASGGVSLMVLGYIDAHPAGPINVWYSSNGEVLKIQNGHVVGLTGGSAQWRHVSFTDMPQWQPNQASKLLFTRTRDVMPGYLFNVTDQLELRKVAAPARSNLAGAQALQLAQRLQWFEAHDLAGQLPPARYAVQSQGSLQTVVYSEQCLSQAFCISWQSWPPTALAP